MVTAEVTAIVAGASAVAGGAIVGASNYVINRVQAADARKAELRRVMIDLGTVVSRIDHRLRTEPEPGKASRAINEAMSRRAPQFDHAIGLLRRRLLDPHPDGLVLDLSRALAAAMVMAPPTMLPALGQLTDAMDGAERRDEAWWACWNAARTNYFLCCREAAGFTVPELADATNDGSASA